MRDQDFTPDPVDLHVGGRVRMRRKFLGLSQEDLAAQIGVTFQQLQKRERGSNRISASALYRTAKALEAPISYFFEGMNDENLSTGSSTSGAEQKVSDFLMTTEGLEVAILFPKLPSAKMRKAFLTFLRNSTDETTVD